MIALLILTAATALTADLQSARSEARWDAARALRAALEPAHGEDRERGLGTLLRAGVAAGDALRDDALAADLDDAIRAARWRAVIDEASARAELEVELRSALADLTFEPLEEARLPAGFPAPTPVRAIELKTYPRYRMVRASTDAGGAFGKLFQHIQRHEIAMTAPVETTQGAGDGESWMAFLYASTEMGRLGADGGVEVVDVEPATVVSLGCRGAASRAAVEQAEQRLRAWLGENKGHEAAGALRTMAYNSPMVPTDRRYFEVQLPVRAVEASAGEVVVHFGDENEARRWGAVDDVVMGGRSQSTFTRTREGTAVFSGHVSLENNGGFASVRSSTWGDDQPLGLAGAQKLRLVYRGDGKTYKLRLRTTGDFDGASYEARFPTEAGVWQARAFDVDDFVSVWRGRRVRGAPELDPAAVRSIGFLISDEQEGPFRLELRSLAKE